MLPFVKTIDMADFNNRLPAMKPNTKDRLSDEITLYMVQCRAGGWRSNEVLPLTAMQFGPSVMKKKNPDAFVRTATNRVMNDDIKASGQAVRRFYWT